MILEMFISCDGFYAKRKPFRLIPTRKGELIFNDDTLESMRQKKSKRPIMQFIENPPIVSMREKNAQLFVPKLILISFNFFFDLMD